MPTTETEPRPAPPVGTARCTIGGTYQSHRWACVFWLNLVTSAPAQADLQSLATKISGAYTPNITTHQTAGTIMNNVSLVWTPTAGFELLASDTTARTGTLAGAEIANTVTCYVVNHRTGAYYRGGHSRSYLPGVSGADVVGASSIAGARTAALATGFQSFVTAIKTGAVGAITSTDVGTVRFASKGDWLIPPVFYPWISHSVRSTFGTQRGRLTE